MLGQNGILIFQENSRIFWENPEDVFGKYFAVIYSIFQCLQRKRDVLVEHHALPGSSREPRSRSEGGHCSLKVFDPMEMAVRIIVLSLSTNHCTN